MDFRFDLTTAYSFESLDARERRELSRKLEAFSNDPDSALAAGWARRIRVPIKAGGPAQDLVEIRGPNQLRVFLRSVDDGWVIIDLLRHNVIAS